MSISGNSTELRLSRPLLNTEAVLGGERDSGKIFLNFFDLYHLTVDHILKPLYQCLAAGHESGFVPDAFLEWSTARQGARHGSVTSLLAEFTKYHTGFKAATELLTEKLSSDAIFASFHEAASKSTEAAGKVLLPTYCLPEPAQLLDATNRTISAIHTLPGRPKGASWYLRILPETHASGPQESGPFAKCLGFYEEMRWINY